MSLKFNYKKTRFSGSDLVIILVIAVIIAAVIFLRNNISSQGSTSNDKVVEIEYAIEFKMVPAAVIKQIEAGDSARDPDNKQYIGTIVSAEETPYSELVYNFNDNTPVLSENPEYSNLIITLRAEAVHNDTGYYINGTKFLVGKQSHFWTKGFASTGYCVGITELD